MYEPLGSPRAHEQHGPPQRVPVPIELLSAHGVEEVGEDAADVAVDPLQGDVQSQSRRLVHEVLQTTYVWEE